MGKLFNLNNNQVIVEPELLLIPEFSKIWNRDTSKTKTQAWKELAYIYYITDYMSPYSDIENKEDIVKTDFIKDLSWQPDNDIKAALDKYEILQETQSMKLLVGAKHAANKLNQYFMHLDFNERDDKGKPITTPTEVTMALKNIGGVLDSLNKLSEQVKKEKLVKTKIRGGGQTGNREE